MAQSRSLAGEIADEFSGSDLGDRRLVARAVTIAERVASAPDASFPEQMRTEAEQEGLYRFFANSRVDPSGLLAGHVVQTHGRCKERRSIRVVYDTSDFRYEGEREGLGILNREARGFYAHFALAVAANELREPLGVLDIRPYIREEEKIRAGRKKTRGQRSTELLSTPRTHKSSSRWEKTAIDVAALLPADVEAVHVMDQEADDYELFAQLLTAKINFVVRIDPERRTASGRTPACDVLEENRARVLRTVALSERKRGRGKCHPKRHERDADLRVRWGQITLPRTQNAETDVRELTLSAVHVFESNPPSDEPPVNWMLVTSQPVTSFDEAVQVVDHYRARWLIEEYFKALKTGCNVEKRQLTTYEGLVRAVALFAPIAWRLLLLRYMSRAEPKRPATSAFDAEQLRLLAALLALRKRDLPANPTIHDAMLGIAALGGHIRNNGDPGWQVLGRGFERFLEAEVGWRLARSDQS
jgi:Transposase DNA-binding/Transposase DDE domain